MVSERNSTQGKYSQLAGQVLYSLSHCVQVSFSLSLVAVDQYLLKSLIRFSSDVNYLSATAPPAAAEWSNLLRPLRGKEPEGMWNLLAIIKEMFRKADNNAVDLLTIITDECLACEQVLTMRVIDISVLLEVLVVSNHVCLFDKSTCCLIFADRGVVVQHKSLTWVFQHDKSIVGTDGHRHF